MKKVVLLLTVLAVAAAAAFAGLLSSFGDGVGVGKLSLYKKYNDRGVYSKYGETYVSEWNSGSDITSIFPIASDAGEISIDGRHYQDVWKEAWNAFTGTEGSRICYRVEFSTSDGKSFDCMIMKPGDELQYREYLENYLYDDIRVEKGVWYSHLEPDEEGDVIMSSMKVTAGEKVDYINTPVRITACVYRGSGDFDDKGLYTGSVSASVTLTRKASKLGVSATRNGEKLHNVLDDDYYSDVTVESGDKIIVKSSKPMAGIYILWNAPVKEWTLSLGGRSEKHGADGFLHEYVPTGGAAECTLEISGWSKICEIYAYSEGNLPDSVQTWQKPLEAADLLVFSTHADDEVLFFGGAITLYNAMDYRTQVVYLCNYWNGEKVREHEKLDGLWTMGLRHYPVNLPFDDEYAESLEEAMEDYDYPAVLAAVAENVRRFKPHVIVTHDVNGEYGHGGHMLLSKAVRDAVENTADSSFETASAEKYGVWNVPKTYLHLYGENALRLNLRENMSALGGRTPLEIEKEAYLRHKSQQWTWFYVDDEYKYSCAAFGLYRTTVGSDSGKNDMMENIVSYGEQERIAEERRQEEERKAEEERQRLEEEERRRREEEEKNRTNAPQSGTADPEGTARPAETGKPPETDKDKPDAGNRKGPGRTLEIVLLILVGLLSVFVLFLTIRSAVRKRR
ncbi:MAG: PIG-L family deacetylase [Clostridia bacterium]|nr:PIG-L family deacetylase [Clostridia bacterium]